MILFGDLLFHAEDIVDDSYRKDPFGEILQFKHVGFILSNVFIFRLFQLKGALFCLDHVLLVDHIPAIGEQGRDSDQVSQLFEAAE